MFSSETDATGNDKPTLLDNVFLGKPIKVEANLVRNNIYLNFSY